MGGKGDARLEHLSNEDARRVCCPADHRKVVSVLSDQVAPPADPRKGVTVLDDHCPITSGRGLDGILSSKDEETISRLFGERTVSISLLLRTLLSLDGQSHDAARSLQLGQDVSHGEGSPSQGGLPQKDVLANSRQEESEVVTSEYTGRKHPRPESPQNYPPKHTMRGPARLESDQEEQDPTVSMISQVCHPGGVDDADDAGAGGQTLAMGVSHKHL